MFALFGTIVAYRLFGTGSRHDEIAIAQQLENVMVDIEAEGDYRQCWLMRSCSTDTCLTAPSHGNYKAYKAGIFSDSDIERIFDEMASSSSSCNNNNIRKIFRIYQPLLFASILRVRNALHPFAIKYKDDEEYPDALLVFCDMEFWRELSAAEEVIRPLSNISYKLQHDESTLADVVVSYRDISLFLHPLHFHVSVAFHKKEHSLRILEKLCGYGIFYYRRYFDRDKIERLAADFHAWY
ncbi:hypothetical protein PHMEG_00014667 [Phytophthora megakarya]|uniref:Uncharacterized protein n=1 Tax=Phytophthora megakarya TaxID=4795 RepID=A0A225W384_9STRA|nr:hypothetical protein PHMEG_00014667 [Phytophthora megakarya]